MFIALVALELSHSKEIKNLHFEDALLRGMRNFSEDETNLKTKKRKSADFLSVFFVHEGSFEACRRQSRLDIGDNFIKKFHVR